jgi:drug/metabolite transporter (DMT)-like permease
MSNSLTVSPSSDNSLQGIGFMIFMTACFTSLDASAKYISSELPLWMVLWGRYVFHFLFITFFFLRTAPKDIIYTKNIKLQILRSTLIFCAGVTFWAGLMYMPLVECMVILFTSPLLVTVLAVPLLGEKFGLHRWGCVIVGLFGVVLVIRPGIGIIHWAAILPLCAALFYASLQIVTRVLGKRDSALTTLFYSSICGLIFSSILVIFFWEPPSPTQWLLLMWLGFLGALGHYFMIKAFEKAQASLLAPFNYISLIWAALLGFLLFGDWPDAWTIFGAVIIVSSGLYQIKRETRTFDVYKPIK